jgi:hypothetical protein
MKMIDDTQAMENAKQFTMKKILRLRSDILQHLKKNNTTIAEEYDLIESKKSTLPAAHRDFIVAFYDTTVEEEVQIEESHDNTNE